MIEIKKGLLWVITTLKNSFQKAIEKVLVWIIVAIFIIAVSLLWKFSEVIMMLLSSEVAVFWLFVVIILSSVVVGIIHHTKTKKYNKLFEKTKPPHSIELFKAEAKCYFGAVWVLSDDLSFDIRVINRTNYLFTCKKASIACYHDDNCLFEEGWEDGMLQKHIFPSSLKALEGGNIKFRVPIQKLGDVIDSNNRELELNLVYAKYNTEEDIIHDIPCENVTVKSKHLRYRLDEGTIAKLKGWRERHEAR